jgi:NADH-quinone oxidoreductase subunit J
MDGSLMQIVPMLAESLIPPLALLVLCVAAGVGTVLLLPGKRETSIRKIGGVVLAAVMLILGALVVRLAAVHTAGDAYFWVFSAIAVVGAIRVITHPKPVYSALYFVLTVFASAGLFILLWAEFMAAALILIYAGAILVTYVFVIMLATQAHAGSDEAVEQGEADYDRFSREPVLACAIGFALMGVILFLVFQKGEAVAGGGGPVLMANVAAPAVPPANTSGGVVAQAAPADGQDQSAIRDLGAYLFKNQLVTLELAGLLLTVSMVGAVVIARRQVVSEVPVVSDEVSTKATVTEPNDDPHSIPVYGTRNPRAKAYPER